MKALKAVDVPVFLMVWLLCVGTDWSTGTKIALNVAAVVLLCLKEILLHRSPAAAASASVRGRRRAGAPQLV